MTFFDFNSAAEQSAYDLIPRGTLVPVRMTLKPGGFDDPAQGWTGGYATHSDTTKSVYLNCEFVVLDGEYSRRKLWSRIGLHSPKGPDWGNKGRTFIKAVLNSSRGIWPTDNSPQALQARRILSFAELDGIEFIGRVDWEKDKNEDYSNVIKTAITPDHPDYPILAQALGRTGRSPPPQTSSDDPRYAAASSRPGSGRPSWAK